MKRALLFLLVLSCGVPKGPTEMPSTVSLVQMLAAGMVTSAGVPIASGKARFYLPATLTPVSVYSDTAAATPITPPLTLTAGGTGVAYTKVPTRMIVKDSLEVTTYFDGLVNIERAEQQYIQSSSVAGGAETTMQAWLDGYATSFGGTAGLWKIKTSASASEQNLVDILNAIHVSVKSHAAVGDGIADDTTEIQATATILGDAGGGIMYLPAGTFLTSSVITLPAGVSVQGAGSALTTVKCTNATQGAFATSAGTTARVQRLTVTHSSTSTGTAVASDASGDISIEDVTVDPLFRTAVSITGAARVHVSNSTLASNPADGSSVTVSNAAINSAPVFVQSSKVTSGALSAIKVTGNSNVIIANNSIVATTATVGGIDANGTGALVTSGNQIITGGAIAVAIGSSATNVLLGNDYCTGPITDARTGAPVIYSFAVNGNFTPLPLQAETIRVIGTAAGITITVNGAAAMGFGRTFRIMQINSTGGACTFVYNAQYKLQGGAAANPATGNMIISTFEYDPVSSVYRETARSLSMAI